MGDLGSVGLGVEQEQVEVVGVGDKEGLVAGGAQVTGLLVGTVTNLGHGNGASETTTHTGVDTLGLAPRLANTVVAVRVVTLELLVAVLLDDLGVGEGGGHLCCFVSPKLEVKKRVKRTLASPTTRLQQSYYIASLLKSVAVMIPSV